MQILTTMSRTRMLSRGFISLSLIGLASITSPAFANNLILNAGFEDFTTPNFGNNLNTVSVAPWVLGSGNAPNVVRVDGDGGQNYTRGPEIDGANPGSGIDQHYLDIINGANDFYQSFTVPICPSLSLQTYNVSGFFSSRADRRGNPEPASGSITIRDGVGATGTVVTGPDLSVTNLLDRLTWTALSGDYVLTPGNTYSYVVAMGDNTNFDGSSLVLTSNCLTAVDNDFTSIPFTSSGGTTASVFSNDDIAGSVPTDTSVDVSLTNTNGLTGATINPDGTINIPAGTVPGDYTLTYQICEAGSTTNCHTATVAIFVVRPSLSMTKVADDKGPHTTGDVVTYTYTVVNDGNTTIRGVAITDTHNGSDPAPVPGNETLLTDVAPTGDSTDSAVDGSWDVLAPGDTLTFTGTYTITQTDAENL